MTNQPKYPGIRITTDGNHLVSYLTEARYTEGGVFFPGHAFDDASGETMSDVGLLQLRAGMSW